MDKLDFEKEFRKKLGIYFSALGKRKNSPVKDLFNILKHEKFSVYAFGGFPRDIFLRGTNAHFRDIDLVIEGIQINLFKDVFRDYVIGENKFGGLKIKYKSLIVDIWPLEQTWAFQQKHIESISFQNIEETTFLNFESILFEVNPSISRPRKIFYEGFYNLINSDVLEVNLEPNPFPDLNIVRALYAAKKFNLKIGPKLGEFIIENAKEFEEEHLYSIYKKKYKIGFEIKELSETLLRIQQHFSTSMEPYGVNSAGQQQILEL